MSTLSNINGDIIHLYIDMNRKWEVFQQSNHLNLITDYIIGASDLSHRNIKIYIEKRKGINTWIHRNINPRQPALKLSKNPGNLSRKKPKGKWINTLNP